MKAPGFISAVGGIALAIASVAPFTAHAALKYQTDAYVQDGLIVHLDGIRNVGAGLPHDPGANVWANIADMSNPARIVGNNSSGWRNGYGYYFCWDSSCSYAQLAYATPAMTQATFEFAFEGSWAEQTARSWGPCFVAGASNHNISLGTAASPLYFRSVNWTGTSGAATGQEISNWSWKQASFTFGAAGAGGLKSYDQGIQNKSANRPTAAENSIPATQWMVGQRLGEVAQKYQLTGVMKSARIYNRALTAQEVAQNAAIDAARFEGVMPVTNAIVATSVADAFGSEVPGVYAVDGSHTFTAAPSAKVGSTTYACTGCTVARWENGAWGAAEICDGVFAVTVSEAEKVLITWQWAAAAGTLGADIDAYSTDGIKVWYDGIHNAGKSLPHADAGAWRELVYNMTATMVTNANSHWANDGYYFAVGPNNEVSCAYLPEYVSLGTVGTIEIACEVNRYDQTAISGVSSRWSVYLNFGHRSDSEDSMLIQTCEQQDYLRLADDPWTGNQYDDFGNWDFRVNTSSGWDFRHAAFVVDTNDHRSYSNGVRDNTRGRTKEKSMNAAYWVMGNVYAAIANAAKNQQLVGTMKAVRAYNRVLSDAEIARHYSIDVWRFDGMVPVSNAVEVVADIRGLSGREPAGVYFPQGGWAFTAGTATQTVNGVSYAPAGYILETWDATTSAWKVQGSYESSSYTCPSSETFPSVRLIWQWEPVAGIRRASDYDVGDYVQGGLVAWLDGIRNAGATAAHDSNATTWTPLIPQAGEVQFARNDRSHWTEDGYYFCLGSNNERSYVYLRKKLSLGETGTIELAGEIKAADQPGNWPTYIAFNHDGSTDHDLVIQSYQHDNFCRWAAEKWSGNASSARANITAPWDGKYAAFVMDIAQLRSYKAGIVDQTKLRTTVTNMPAVYWMLGNKYDASDVSHQTVGTMKAVRAYNRALSDAEIAQNYKVDVARFDGELVTTNVVVAASDYNGALAADAYEVFGEYTFTASPSSVDGSMPNSVRVKTLAADGSVTSIEDVDGDSYTYITDSSPSRVVIEFRKTNPFVMVFR